MATFEIVEGPPGQGKSLYTAATTERILRRNLKWHKQGNPLRKVYSNIKFSEAFELRWPDQIAYWSDANQLCQLHDCDIIWDEIATELDSRNWVNLSSEMKRFLSQYRKRGVDIYANTQDFSMIDQRARLMITSVRTLTKVVGSRDISTTKPPPKRIWGLVMVREVENWKETEPEKKKYAMVPSFFFITRRLCSMYDTRQDIQVGEKPRLKHSVVYCELYGLPGHDCGYHKVLHS